ncbi:MAG: biopolymer transporter ExbD [Deltaproteobacteria bacterium]|nr:biopolymer transporter ExbD [Deltaproteobacteria bacterium]MBW2412914.1 biopolymer transporter ExbD [Deltaproteobacteria bacterium]
MARRRREFEEASLSMTPLIDVVLLLLIFYMVTTAFQDREIELMLPESDSSAIPEEKKKFVIEIGRGENELAMNGERITVEGLDRVIEVEAAADNIQSVEIKADEYVYHRRVIQVLGIVKKHGVDAVGIAVREKR